MYEDLFDYEKQAAMRKYFLEIAHSIGVIKSYKKNETIVFNNNDCIGIVTNGVLSQSIISIKGQVHAMYILVKGEILGETYYFCGGENNISTTVKEDAQVAFIHREKLDLELAAYPEAYRYFIHSITRKYRIILLHLTNNTFNDSTGKIADALLRLSACCDNNLSGKTRIDFVLTHQDLANNIGCSRITVTNCLNKFLDENLISYEGKYIIINDPEALKEYVDLITE